MEREVFPRPQVQKLLKRYVRAKLFVDKDPANLELMEKRFKSVALPFFVLLSPDEKVLGTYSYTRDANAFAEFLKKGLPAEPENAQLDWHLEYDDALEEARSLGKPLFIDITGIT